MVNKNNFRRLAPFLHEYDFDISEIVEPHISNIILDFKNKPEYFSSTVVTKKAANVKIRNKKLVDTLQIKLEEVLLNNYEIGEWERVEDNMACYIQDDVDFRSVYHNHVGLGIVAVFYLSLPKVGGELEFVNPPKDQFILKPELGKLYFFPYWLLHRPLPQQTNEIRISVNWGVSCKSRPINKLSKDMW